MDRRFDVRAAGDGENDAGQSRRGRVQDHLLQRQRLHARVQVPRGVGKDGTGPVRDGTVLRS